MEGEVRVVSPLVVALWVLGSFVLASKMATATLLSPEAPTSTTSKKILDFFHSLLLLLLNTLRRALLSVSRIGRSSSSPSHSHNTFGLASDHRSGLAAMTPSTSSPNRVQPPKMLPALPLIPSSRSPPERDSKENTAPPRKDAGPLPQYQPQPRPQPQPQPQLGKAEAADKLSERLSHLDLGEANGNPAGSADVTAPPSCPSTPSPNPLPAFVPCPPLPIAEPLTGERAVHSGFMREALDMVRVVAHFPSCFDVFCLLGGGYSRPSSRAALYVWRMTGTSWLIHTTLPINCLLAVLDACFVHCCTNGEISGPTSLGDQRDAGWLCSCLRWKDHREGHERHQHHQERHTTC